MPPRPRCSTTSPSVSEPLGDFVDRHGFSEYFVEHFMTPLVAAVWSCAPGNAMRYPARYLFVFLQHHGMLSVFGSPTWRTVVGGSATYVNAIAQTGARDRRGQAGAGGAAGTRRRADHHGRRQAASVRRGRHRHASRSGVADARRTDDRRNEPCLALFPTPPTTLSCTPTPRCCPAGRGRARRGTTWSTPDVDDVLVTYDVSRLMRLSGSRRFLVTLGGRDRVDPATVIAEMTYGHPTYTPESVAAQRRLPTIDDDRVVFAGAYHGWGFHEDGAASGLRAAQRLGADWPAARRLEAMAR